MSDLWSAISFSHLFIIFGPWALVSTTSLKNYNSELYICFLLNQKNNDHNATLTKNVPAKKEMSDGW